jgi:hypothetical protein
MKKIILTLALVFVAQLGMAQDDAYKKDILKVIERGDFGSQLQMVKAQISKQIPAAKQPAFLIEFDASLAGLYEKLMPSYMETYTKDDVKAILAFYESPVGKKMALKASELNEKAEVVGKEWGEGLQGMMMKYMQ